MQTKEQTESAPDPKQVCIKDRLSRFGYRLEAVEGRYTDADIIALALERINNLEAVVESKWWPIWTAPKDGTPFLWTNEGRFAVINWPEYDGCFSSGSWMPLPPPPAEYKPQP